MTVVGLSRPWKGAHGGHPFGWHSGSRCQHLVASVLQLSGRMVRSGLDHELRLAIEVAMSSWPQRPFVDSGSIPDADCHYY